MTALPPDAVADLYKLVAELEQRLESGFTAHDAAIARAAATAQENARLRNEIEVARERQNATADILGTIANVSGDADRALYQIAETSARLFGAPSATIHIAEGDGWAKTIRVGDSSKRVGAGVPEAQLKIGGRNMPGTIVGDNRQVHIPDVDNVDAAISDWPGLPYVRAAGTRSMSGSPLRREGKAIGALIVYRDRLASFTDEEMALQQTFADQAAIAIENARLFNNTREALERQTATADILKVIASSPSDAQPVFEAIATSANRLVGGYSTAVFSIANDSLYLSAFTPTNPTADAALKGSFPRPLSGGPWAEQIRSGEVIQVPDIETDPAVPESFRKLWRMRGFRGLLLVPLVRDRVTIGMINVTRTESGAFAPHHVQLLQTFADQAVIAIENVRLFNETREALERQTATAEILKVIAGSPSEVRPVFEAIAHSANRLIDGFSATVMLFVDDALQLVAFTPTNPAADEMLQATFPRPLAEFPLFELVRNGQTVQFRDTESEDVPPLNRTMARSRGYRSMVFTPLMNNGAAIGILSVTRVQPGSFAVHHEQLLQTFADQAVIAIENVRLFNEVQQRTDDLSESLQQQTATADVLKVISRSVFDLQTVLDTLIDSAYTLCGARMGLLYLRGEQAFECRAIAGAGTPEAARVFKGRPIQAGRGTAAERVIMTGEVQSVPDLFEDPEVDPTVKEMIRNAANTGSGAGQVRSTLAVPMTRDGSVIGVMVIARAETGLFPSRQIELLQTFADQAVIAIENARLFDEVQAKTRDLSEALTYQTGSGNILRVIASSPTDVKPVLAAIVESACELCEADDALAILKDGEELVFQAQHGSIPVVWDRQPIDRDAAAGRAVIDRAAVHIHDLLGPEGEQLPRAREFARRTNVRTVLSVPLLREGESIGAIVLRRTEVRPFSDKQIALLQTFADQAVIAIGNVRLFEEVQARTRELSETLEQQTATADVLKVISRSPDALQPVLDAIVETSRELCHSDASTIFLLRDNSFHVAAVSGAVPAHLEYLRTNPIAIDQRGSILARVAREKRTLYYRNVADDPELNQGSTGLGGPRALVTVPLIQDGHVIGAITLRQSHLKPFTARQIEAIETFADQAVIAISNVNLFEEVQARTRDLTESLQQQTATSEVLKVISSSPGELEPVFRSMLENAVKICDAQFGNLLLVDGDRAHWEAGVGTPPKLAEFFTQSTWFQPTPGSHVHRVMQTKQVSHTADDMAEPVVGAAARLGGARSTVCVPMVKDDTLVGTIFIYRTEVRPFTDKQIDLVKNFAAQAVIAIENTRLLKELRQRTDDLTKSLDDLRTAQDRLVQTEKLASLGQLTAGIAHEIKNPLNFVNNFAALSAELTGELNDVLKQATITEKIRGEVDELTGLLKDNLQKVVQHGQRADSIVKNMLLHSREGSGDHRPTDINALVDESLNLAYHGARAEKPDFNVTLQRDFDAGAGTIEVFPQEITRVFLNLVSNGFYAVNKRRLAAGEDGFDPLLVAATRNLGDAVEIRIRDNGTGIPQDVRDKMFNPFFTTKPAGEGTGLGLSMSHDIIVKQHGGTIDVDTEPGHFTEFRIVLPRTGNPPNKTRG